MTTPLSALVSIISSGVQSLESTYSNHGSRFPSLDEPYKPGALSDDPAVVDTTRLIVAAAAQLIAAVRSPEETIQEFAPSMFISSSLGFTVDTNVPDILHEAGPKGLHATEIASKTGTNANHLARVMRFLATRHVFREVTPDVFANNRISSAMVKSGKTLTDIQVKPMHRYDDAGIAAAIGHMCDEGLKSNAFLTEYLKDPSQHTSPFNIAFNTKLSVWEWFGQPGNDWRLRRFITLMTRYGKLFKDNVFIEAIDWKALKASDVVVDVAGNIGTVTLTLAKAFPHLKYVVQDLGKVIPNAGKFWAVQYPEAITDGRVTLQEYDFFQEQPVKGAAIYFMRFIVHDWPDAESIKILKNIRAAASPTSKLILFENCVEYACLDPAHSSESRKAPPYPLLPNLGMGGGAYLTMVDLHMMTIFGGQERTPGGYLALGNATGWKLQSMKHGLPATFVFTPA